ncbi:hypothetical protein Tco_0393521 [Tanacetum coccineum]
MQTTHVAIEAATLPRDSPLPRVHLLGSDGGTHYKGEKVGKEVKLNKAKRRAKIVGSDDEDAKKDTSKQGRNVARVHTYSRRRRTVSTSSGGISTAEESVSTTGASMPVSTAGMDQGSIPSPSASKEKGKAIMTKFEPEQATTKLKQRQEIASYKAAIRFQEQLDEEESQRIARDAEVAQRLQEGIDASERQRKAQVHQAAQGFTDAEWNDILARVVADKDLVQQLQAGEKYSEKDLPMKLVELVKEIFEATMRRVQSFVPMDSKLVVQRLKRVGSGEEQSAKKEKELSEEELQKLMIIGPVEEVYVEALQRLFKPDIDDILWKLPRYMHDPLTWRLYNICGVHHVSIDRGHDIFMLVEKDYPLIRGLMTVMLANKL